MAPSPAPSPALKPTLGPLPPEIALWILDNLPRRDQHTLRRLNSAWRAAADRALTPHSTLGLPVPENRCPFLGDVLPTLPSDVRPVPRAHLSALQAHGATVSTLDIHPHSCCAPLTLPNLAVLRIFPTRDHSELRLALCASDRCAALASLRPRTLVVYASLSAGDLLPALPHLVPPALLGHVTRLVLVLPAATASYVPVPRWTRTHNVALVLAHHRRGFLTPAPQKAGAYTRPLGAFFTIVGGERIRREYEMQHAGLVRWMGAEYFATRRSAFTAAETAAMEAV